MPEFLPHTASLSQLEKNYQTSLKNGLSSDQIESQQLKFGSNVLPKSNKIVWLESLKAALTSPIIVLLIVATVITLLLHEYIESFMIALTIVLNTLMSVVQEVRASKAIDQLKNMQGSKARLVRDGQEQLVDSDEVLVGDILVFEAGDKIAADGRLIEAADLRLNESLLTGEATLASKELGVTKGATLIAEQTNMVFSGSFVGAGHGMALIVAVGADTELGNIAKEVSDKEISKTLLEKRLGSLAKWLVSIVPVLSIGVFAIGLLRGYQPYELFLVTVSLMVSVVPEGLTLGVTIALAVAAWRMAKQGSILRNLASAETLGSTTILAVDKTGTLTKNELTATHLYCLGLQLMRSVDEVPGWQVESGSYNKQDRQMATEQAKKLALIGALCNTSHIIEKDGRTVTIGDPLEGALKVLATEQNLDLVQLENQYPKIAEVPFSSELRYMVTIHQSDKQELVAVKGAPTEVIELCSFEWVGDRKVKFTAATKQQWLDTASQEAATGLRMMAFAYKEGDYDPHKPVDQPVNQLGFVGLAGFVDPLQPGVDKAIKQIQKSGVKVMMITGDHALTAQSIAKSLGLKSDKVVTGADIESLQPDELYARLKETAVCARVAPQHKQKIVEVLKMQGGEIVAMTGDGVNDAPALVGADIGVAMGKGGTDVAREASDLVLTSNQFSAIVASVYEGRSLVANIRKMITFLLSTNASGMLVVTTSFAFGLPVPVNASQLLWMNLVTSGLPDTSLIFEPREESLVSQKPDGNKLYLINKAMAARIIWLGLWIGGGSFLVFFIAWQTTGNILYAQTMALAQLVMFQLANAFNSQSATASMFTTWLKNKFLFWSVIFGIVLQVGIPYTPFGRDILRVMPLSLTDWIVIACLSLSLIVVEEIRKYIVRRRTR